MVATAHASRKTVNCNDIRDYLHLLEENGLLQRITAEVDLKYEVGAICSRSLKRGGPAISFENIRGYAGLPLVANLLGSIRHLAVAFGTEESEEQVYEAIVDGMRNRVASVLLPTGPCKEEIVRGDDVDLYKWPTPFWHEHDGGQFIATTAGFITRNPEDGRYNMGSYRCMIKSRNEISMAGGLRTPRDPGGGDHILMNEAKGLPTPVAVVLGMDPYLSLATGSPVPMDENGFAEYEAAGAWRGRPTELVKCETSDLLVPANAEIVLEGEAIPGVRTEEGPHGESTGFYGENKSAFLIKINCVTQRRNPVSYGLICQLIEDYPRSLLRSGSFQTLLIEKTGMTNIKHAYFPEVGRFGMLIVSAEIRDADEPRRIMDAVWEHGDWRWVIVVDEDCDVRDWDDVMWRVVSTAQPEKHIVLGRERKRRSSRRTDEDDFDPPTRGMGIDATMRFKGVKYPPVNIVGADLMRQVTSRWKEYGLP
jgi:4-hydroxy-3-polyprenylbenzoate decarboxylase